jgi:hypothetical protein
MGARWGTPNAKEPKIKMMKKKEKKKEKKSLQKNS